MKTKSEVRNPKSEGIMLIECLVYITVLMILMGLGFAAFYSCWDKSKSLRYHADGITATLHAGEHWRSDIRAATGRITVETSANRQTVRIPHDGEAVLYEFADGNVRRRVSPAGSWTPVLGRVKTSQMTADPRKHVVAWRWDVELVPNRPQVQVPPVFTFQAVPSTAP